MLRIDYLEGNVIPGFQPGRYGAEVTQAVDGVAIDGDDDCSFAESDLVGKCSRLNRLNENAVQFAWSALRKIGDRNTELRLRVLRVVALVRVVFVALIVVQRFHHLRAI